MFSYNLTLHLFHFINQDRNTPRQSSSSGSERRDLDGYCSGDYSGGRDMDGGRPNDDRSFDQGESQSSRLSSREERRREVEGGRDGKRDGSRLSRHNSISGSERSSSQVRRDHRRSSSQERRGYDRSEEVNPVRQERRGSSIERQIENIQRRSQRAIRSSSIDREGLLDKQTERLSKRDVSDKSDSDRQSEEGGRRLSISDRRSEERRRDTRERDRERDRRRNLDDGGRYMSSQGERYSGKGGDKSPRLRQLKEQGDFDGQPSYESHAGRYSPGQSRRGRLNRSQSRDCDRDGEVVHRSDMERSDQHRSLEQFGEPQHSDWDNDRCSSGRDRPAYDHSDQQNGRRRYRHGDFDISCHDADQWTQHTSRPPPEGRTQSLEDSSAVKGEYNSGDGDTGSLNKICILAKMSEKLRVQINHFQYLFLLRLSESFSAFQADLQADQLALQSHTVVQRRKSQPLPPYQAAPPPSPPAITFVPIMLKVSRQLFYVL